MSADTPLASKTWHVRIDIAEHDYDEVEDVISASDFIEMTDGAQLLFI